MVLVIYEGENITNLQIEGQPEFFLPISDPVFPYVTNASVDAEVTIAYLRLKWPLSHQMKKTGPSCSDSPEKHLKAAAHQ